MTDPSQLCPPSWREYNTSGVRGCGRPFSSGGSRPANFYTIDRQYSKVCGKIIGYQVGSPDGFNQYHGMISLNQGYMVGVSITYGHPRHHMLLVHMRLVLHRAIAHALQHKELSHKNLLAVTSTVNQDILATHSYL